MAGHDTTLQNKNGEDEFPRTFERNVYDENGQNLKEKMKSIVFNDNKAHLFSRELYEESYNLLDVSKFIGTSGFESAKLEDNGYEITGATGSADVWSYANSNVKLTLEAGTYYLNYDIVSSNSNSGLNIFNSNNSVIRYGKGSFTLTEKTDIGIMVKVFAGGSLKINITPTTTMMNYQKFNPNRHITNPQAEFLKDDYEKSYNLYDKNKGNILYDFAFYEGGFFKYQGIDIIYFELDENTNYSLKIFNPDWYTSYKFCLTNEIPNTSSSVNSFYAGVNQLSFNSSNYKYLVIGEIARDVLQEVNNNLLIAKGTEIPKTYYDFNPNRNITNSEANFLKSEHAKSLNIFKHKTVSVSANGQTYAMEWFPVKVKPYTEYTLSFDYTQTELTGYLAIVRDIGNLNIDLANSLNGHVSYTFETTGPNNIDIWFLASTGTASNNNITFDNIMINEGTEPFPYQEYNGELIHKKDIETVLLWSGNADGNINYNANDYDGIKILYHDDSGSYNEVNVRLDEMNKVFLISGTSFSDDMYVSCKNISVSRTGVVVEGYNQIVCNSGSVSSQNSNRIYIREIWGYKEV